MTATGVVDISVDARDAVFMLEKAREVLSGVQLAYFLETRVDPYFRDRMEERFANEGDEFGKWAPLSPATNAIRLAEGHTPQHPINERTGGLKDWMLQEGIIHASQLEAQIDFPGRPPGGDPELAQKLATAQHGKKRNPRTRPRPVLAWSERDTVETVRRLAEWFVWALSR